MGKLGGKTFNVNQLFLTYLPFKNLKEMNPLSFTLLALAAAVCLSVPISTYPLNQRSINHEFGFLEDIENEIIKDTIKSTVKSLIENAQCAVENGKDFDEVIQKLGSELESFGKVALWAVKEYVKWNKESISATLGDKITEVVDKLLEATEGSQSLGWLEDLENEVIKETLKSTIKGLVDSAEEALQSGENLEDIVAKLAKQFKAFGKVALWAAKEYLKYNKESISARLGDELSQLINRLLSEAA